jgi:hypothetical protein
VPTDTVIQVKVYPQARRTLADLGFDLKEFERFADPYLPQLYHYSNLEKGISIRVEPDGAVSLIEYSPRTIDHNRRCPNAPQQPPRLALPFDPYSGLSLSDQRARLRNFAVRLRQEPESIGYVSGYTRANQGKARLIVLLAGAQKYLVETGVESERVRTIEGGRAIERRWNFLCCRRFLLRLRPLLLPNPVRPAMADDQL